MVSRNIFSICSIGQLGGLCQQKFANMFGNQMLLIYPLDRAFRIEQNWAQIRSLLRFETRVNKISWISTEHFGRAFGNESEQPLAAAPIRAMGDNDSSAQSFSSGLPQH